MDLLPTLLDFIDEKPSSEKIDGISIKNNLLNQVKLPERAVFYAYNNRSFIRRDQWKLIKIKGQKEEKFELFDLSRDLAEKNDVSSKNTDLLNELKEKLSKWENEDRKEVKKVSG